MHGNGNLSVSVTMEKEISKLISMVCKIVNCDLRYRWFVVNGIQLEEKKHWYGPLSLVQSIVVWMVEIHTFDHTVPKGDYCAFIKGTG